MQKAFVLGAGWGTRLRPLTSVLPKPLIPFVNRPLITYAFDLLRSAGVDSFLVNTHHLPGAYQETFPERSHAGCPITFVEEQPEILETGGGIANIASHVRDGSFWVFNGDILTDLPLVRALEVHRERNDLATLLLRSSGPNPNVTFDPEAGAVSDLRQLRGTAPDRFFQFTGIYLVHPDFLDFLRPVKESVVPAFLRAIEEGGRLGGVLIDRGDWWDVGDRAAYLAATRACLERGTFQGRELERQRIAPSARIDPSAEVDTLTVLGPDVEVGPGAKLHESILWRGTRVEAGASLHRCIGLGRSPIAGAHRDEDF